MWAGGKADAAETWATPQADRFGAIGRGQADAWVEVASMPASAMGAGIGPGLWAETFTPPLAVAAGMSLPVVGGHMQWPGPGCLVLGAER